MKRFECRKIYTEKYAYVKQMLTRWPVRAKERVLSTRLFRHFLFKFWSITWFGWVPTNNNYYSFARAYTCEVYIPPTPYPSTCSTSYLDIDKLNRLLKALNPDHHEDVYWDHKKGVLRGVQGLAKGACKVDVGMQVVSSCTIVSWCKYVLPHSCSEVLSRKRVLSHSR